MPRISVDVIYMQIAYQISKLSYAERRKVGCIVVKDEQIVSFGYNGTPHGFDNQCEETQTRNIDNPDHKEILIEKGYECEDTCCSKQVTKQEVLHAESNALMKISKSKISAVKVSTVKKYVIFRSTVVEIHASGVSEQVAYEVKVSYKEIKGKAESWLP